MELSRNAIDAMDETVAYAASHHARASAAAELAHLENACGIIAQTEAREATLERRIAARQKLLATGPVTEKMRRELREANELDDQELCIIRGEREANAVAAILGRMFLWSAVTIGCVLMLAHFIAANWGL